MRIFASGIQASGGPFGNNRKTGTFVALCRDSTARMKAVTTGNPFRPFLKKCMHNKSTAESHDQISAWSSSKIHIA